MGVSASVRPATENQDLKSDSQKKPVDTKSSPATKNPDCCITSAKDAKLAAAQGNLSKAPLSPEKQVTSFKTTQDNTLKVSDPKAAEASHSKTPPSPDKQVTCVKETKCNMSKCSDPKAAEALHSKTPPSPEKQVTSIKATQDNTSKVSDPKAAEGSHSKTPPSPDKQESPSKLPSQGTAKDKTSNDLANVAETETDPSQSMPDVSKKGLRIPRRIFSSFNRFWDSIKNFKARMTSSVSPSHLDVAESESGISNESRVESSMFLNQQKLDDVLNTYRKKLSVLLVFPNTGKQYAAFCEAIKRTNFCQPLHAANGKSSITYCKEYIFDLIIIDATNEKLLDAKHLCRKLRAHSPRTVIVAVRRRTYLPWPWKSKSEELSSYLAAGFTRDFFENNSIVACQDALMCFEKDVHSMIQLRFLKSLFAAVENCQEAIEISDVNHELQFVNKAYERLLGYSMDEVIGRPWYELLVTDRNPSDQTMKIKQQLDSYNSWEGSNYIKKKNGEHTANTCRIIPLIEAGKVLQFIGIRRIMDSKQGEQKMTIDSPSSSNQSGWQTTDIHTGYRRMSSGLRERMMSITATQSPHSLFSNQNLMSDVTAALASIKSHQCPQIVYQIIDRVTDMLRTNDRAMRVASIFKEDDELVTELMEGLTTASIPTNVEEDLRGRRRSTYYALSKSVSRMATRRSEDGDISVSPIPLAVSTQSSAVEIRRMLENVFSWDFNIIRLEELTNRRPLLYVGLKIFQTYEVYSFLNTDAATFKNWLDIIEHNYNAHNPYHNSTHAADVLQAAAALCRRQKLMEVFDDMDIVSTLLAAVIHDLDHPGKTNSFLINSGHRLAILYNDVSVLENHHTALAFRLTFKDNTVNIFQKVEKDDYRILRQQIIDMVLATDMTKHFDYLNRFNDIIQRPAVDTPSSSPGIRTYPVEVRTVVKRMLIKCCDVSNPTRQLEACKVWAQRIAEEYCRQTDEEKARGLQVVMPVFDRTKCNLPKTQLSFMNLFIISMMESWNEFCSVPDLMRNLETNFEYWQQMEPSTKEKVVRVVTN